MDKIVEINCIEHIYPDKTKVELCGIEFAVNRGEIVALLGPNGGGKTTLIKHILGILTPNNGQVSVFGVNPFTDYEKIRSKIGVVFQSVEEQLIGPTVLDDVAFTPLNYGYSKEQSKALAFEIMNKLEIIHLKDKVIHYLSGGEKRKVALAGALVLNPELLILDEPFSGLDYKSVKELISLINYVSNEDKMSVIVSTHDVEYVSDFADTMYLIAKNQISKKGSPKEIFNLCNEIRDYNLEEPTIIKLFNMLRSEGLDLGSPLHIEEAAKLLLDHFKSKIK